MSLDRSTTFSAISTRTSPPVISQLMAAALANPKLISLAAGFVDQGSLPTDETKEVLDAVLSDPVEGRRVLQYGTTIGDPEFRSELLRLLERDQGVSTGTYGKFLPRTIVTSGSQQLLYLISEALLEPGDIVLVESPTYFVFLGVLETRGARAVGIEIDTGGMKLDALEEAFAEIESRGELDRVKLVYSITEHSNPSGLSLAADRRRGLLETIKRWSKHRRIYLLEDAAYRGLNYDAAEPPSVWSYDADGETVVLARTFSKTYAPGVKTGFAVVPTTLLGPLLDLKGNHDFGSSNLNQMMLSRLLSGGAYERHRESLLPMYRSKLKAMLNALEEHFGGVDGVSWTVPNGGLFVWFSAPEGVDLGPDGPMWAKCVDKGVLYVPGNFALPGEPGRVERNHARLCFGVPNEADLNEGTRRMAEALAECLDPVA